MKYYLNKTARVKKIYEGGQNKRNTLQLTVMHSYTTDPSTSALKWQ